MKRSIFTLAILALVFSCKKYEHGPSFSLLSKKSRLTGSWRLTEAWYNEDIAYYNSFYVENVHTYGKNFDYVITGEANQVQPAVQEGTWAFYEKKTKLIRIVDGVADTMKILRLKESSLWLKREVDFGYYLFKYEPID